MTISVFQFEVSNMGDNWMFCNLFEVILVICSAKITIKKNEVCIFTCGIIYGSLVRTYL